ncbi:choline transporter-like (slc family 44) [Holotrichia oblita]|uniref:Choline transporter-like (Slc family 44) n=1 Tax=Holotrichia oblita TaxID=644536 RepID=A0ACB9TWW8_HOLOL|nr:choline transporter-like (slc family 44) [Holotrichia oblita]
MEIIFSVILVALLRFFVGFLVWVVLIGVVLFSTIVTGILWYLYKQHTDDKNNEIAYFGITISNDKKSYYLVGAIIATVVTLCVIVIIFALRKRIKLVVQLFTEAGKSITAMPLLLFEPILTLTSLLGVIICWFYFCLWIQSSGYLTYIREQFFTYQPDTAMKIAGFWNLFCMLWMCEFIIGCQHMVLAGSIATWYFTRNKNNLGNPVLYSFYNLVKYHLGSVCFGSLLVASVQLVRILLAMLQRYLRNKTGKCARCTLSCCQCCLYCFEKILKYISRNAYIEIAMYGRNFCESGRQAFKLLVNNSLRVTVINSVGDFVLLLTKILVVVATVLIGIQMLEMAIDTIFLCFCEDCEQNDGISRPYYMSKSLMNFVENSKKAMKVQNGPPIPNAPPTTITDKV